MISPEKAPVPESRFSRVKTVPLGAATLLFVSGTTAREEAPYDVARQTEVVFARIGEMLAEHGAALADIVKIGVFLTDMREYDQYNAVRNRIFADVSGRPALRIEIEAVAIVRAGA